MRELKHRAHRLRWRAGIARRQRSGRRGSTFASVSVFVMRDPIDSIVLDSENARAQRAALAQHLTAEIRDPRVLDAMARVPRHLFMPSSPLSHAYADRPASIGHGQTISQPTVVAIMTHALQLEGNERVLEIGTGSGYQTAILSLLAKEIYTMEIVRALADEAAARLRRLGYADNVHLRLGDGYEGWPTEAPFDRILVTAAPDEIPEELIDQLGEGGILVLPLGSSGWTQRLRRYRKKQGSVWSEDLGGVRFVPMVSGPTRS
jgi:protein-L-isoaspartate(D-aspartate) O-methyltransferase